MTALTRFLGDTPLRALLKLLILSFIVGLVMSAFDWTPWDLMRSARDFVVALWETGFEALGRFGEYMIAGAAIVIPVFLLLRLVSWRR